MGISIFRRIQLLAQTFNEVHSNILISMLIAPSILQIGSMYLVNRGISGKMEIPIVTLIMMAILIVDGAIAILGIFGIAGEVHRTSKDVIFKLRNIDEKLWRRRNRMVNKKTLRSVPILKIKFGAANYVEKTTSLKFCEFNIKLVVDLLLLDN